MTAPYDVRAWLTWGIAVMAPALIARNPLVLLELLAIVMSIRLICVGRERIAGWSVFLRIAVFLVAIGIVFNILTVHSGDRVLVVIPSGWPVIGGKVTLNALAYGAVSGLALVILVVTGVTLASLLRWTELTRIVPRSLTPVAVAGSVAWAFLPRMASTLREIRDVNLIRGKPIRGSRDLLPLLVPLLASGLDRAVTTSEALEARGFGVTAGKAEPSRTWTRWLLAGGLVLMLLGAYGVVAHASIPWAVTGVAGLTGIGFAMRCLGDGKATTRYRVMRRTVRDRIVVAASVAAMAGFIWRLAAVPECLRFDPYPSLAAPLVDLPAMLFLALLIVPALIAVPLAEDRS
jgi:energy-coupling factor transport system permease protein